MKNRLMILSCLLTVTILTADTAKAAIIYDTITGITQSGLKPLTQGANGSPLGDSFSVGNSGQITSVLLTLAASNPADGGIVLVFLVANSGTNIPSSAGVVLTNKTLLGIVFDSSLAATAQDIALNSLSTSLPSAGRYWIELVNSSDTSNGGTGTPSSASWAFNSNAAGTGATGEFESFVNGAGTALTNSSTTNGAFRMTVNGTTATPEPSSFAFLGSGLAGIGLILNQAEKMTK